MPRLPARLLLLLIAVPLAAAACAAPGKPAPSGGQPTTRDREALPHEAPARSPTN